MPTISVDNLSKQFDGHPVFSDVSFTIPNGETTVFVGPNGCGKSTLFKLISQIETEDAGTIMIHDLDSLRFSYVFQGSSDTLLPWRTNKQNLAFPLELQGHAKDVIEQRVEEMQQLIDLPIYWDKYPYQLSGGQRQILAFMRALIVRPTLLLLDEPFSALDYEWTIRLRNYLQQYCSQHHTTTLLITHSIEEAVYLADQIVVFTNRPTRIAATINNPISRPRSIKDIGSSAFTSVQRNILEVFHNVITHEETHSHWPVTDPHHLDARV